MNTPVLPLQKLIDIIDGIEFNSKKCAYGNCQDKPIVSHTISKNYLYKINKDLTKILMLQPKLLPILTKQYPNYIRKVDQDKFSTFVGFCEKDDCKLFKSIDSFDGIIDKEKAALVHYSNICYGVHHIERWRKIANYLSLHNYESNDSTTLEDRKVVAMLKNPYFKNRLDFW